MHTYLGGFEVNKDVMIVVDGMCIGMRIATPALEVFAADQTSIDIEIQRRYRTDFFKIKV